jgi:Trk K+ transport system NAD-binding subunit
VQRFRLASGWENNLARSVAQQLSRHGDPVKIIVTQPDREEGVRSAGLEYAFLENINLHPEDVETILALGIQDDENVRISQMARQYVIRHVLARIIRESKSSSRDCKSSSCSTSCWRIVNTML